MCQICLENPKCTTEECQNAPYLRNWAISGSTAAVLASTKGLYGIWVFPQTDNLGRTALHAAAAGDMEGAVAALLKLGADRALRDGQGRTAGELAAENGHELLAALISFYEGTSTEEEEEEEEEKEEEEKREKEEEKEKEEEEKEKEEEEEEEEEEEKEKEEEEEEEEA